MTDDSAVKLNDVVAGDIKRTRSGRVSLPPLAFWAGERLFTSLNSGESALYIPPNPVEKNASYISPSVGLHGKLLNSLPSVELSKSGGEILQTKSKQNMRQPNRTAAAKKEKVVDKRITSDQNDLNSLPDYNHQNSDANNSEHLKRNIEPSPNQNHSLAGNLLPLNARDKGPKQSSLCSSTTPTTSSSDSNDRANASDRVPPSKKKTVTWSDSKSSLSSASSKDIFKTAISNSRRLRSEKISTPLKSALIHKPNSMENDCLSFNFFDNEQKQINHQHNIDQNSLENEQRTTKNRSITEDKAQKHKRVKGKPVVESDEPMSSLLGDDDERKSSSEKEDSDPNYTPIIRNKTVAQTKAQKHKQIKGKPAVVNECPIASLFGYEGKHKSNSGGKESSDENDLPTIRNKTVTQTKAQKHKKLKGKPTTVNGCPITGLFDNEGKHKSSSDDEESSDHNDLPVTRSKTIAQIKVQEHRNIKGKSTVKGGYPTTGLFGNEIKPKSGSGEESSDHSDPPIARKKTVAQTKAQKHSKVKSKSTIIGDYLITGLFSNEGKHKSSSDDEESSDHNGPPITRNKTISQTKAQKQSKVKGKSTVKGDCPISGLFGNEGKHKSNSDDEESSDHNDLPVTRNKTVAQTKAQRHSKVKSKSTIKGDCPITGLFSNEGKHKSSGDDEESSDPYDLPVTRNKTISQTKAQKQSKVKGKSTVKGDCPISGLFCNEGKHKSSSDDEESSDHNDLPVTRNKTVAQTKAQKHRNVKGKVTIKGDCPISGLFGNEGNHKSSSDDEESSDHNDLPVTRNKTVARTKTQKYNKVKSKSTIKGDCPITGLFSNEGKHKSSSDDEKSSDDNDLPITRNKTVSQTKMQKHRKAKGKSNVKSNCPMTGLSGNESKHKSSSGDEESSEPITRNKTVAHGIVFIDPCKSHHSEIKKHGKATSRENSLSFSSVSENEGDHYTPRRLCQPKRKRLAHAIIEDDSDSPGPAVEVSHLGKKIRKSPEKGTLVLDSGADSQTLQKTTEKNIPQSSAFTKSNVKSTSQRNTTPSTTFAKRNVKRATHSAAKDVQTSASEKNSELATAPVVRCNHQSSEFGGSSINPEEAHTGPAAENSSDIGLASPLECHLLSDPESASDTEFHEDIDDNIHENENNLVGKNVSACCIADLFADSPKPNSCRKIVSAYLKRTPNPTTTRTGTSKKHSQSWKNLKRTLHTHINHMKKTANDKNKDAFKARGSKPMSLRRELIDMKVPKAGTLKMKKWLKQQQDELNRGYKEDDFFKNVNLPNMKPLMKNLNMTEETSELNLDFTTPRPKFHSDLSKRKSPSPQLNDSIFKFVTNKKLADACVHRRKKRLKRKDDDEKAEKKKKKVQSEETDKLSPESTTPPALTQEVIKQAMQDVNDMLSRAAVEDQEDVMSIISSDELEDYYFDDI